MRCYLIDRPISGRVFVLLFDAYRHRVCVHGYNQGTVMTHIIQLFVQWVSHMMDHHWRRRTVRLRKKQNLAEGAGARASALYLENKCVFCEKTRDEKGHKEWDECGCS